LHNVMTKEECATLIEVSEKTGFEDASVFCHFYRERLNDRLTFNDTELADHIWERCKPFVPQEFNHNGNLWKACGLNIRFRCCKYLSGHYFGRHIDGRYTPNGKLQSWMTLMFYINDDFTGGNTVFYDINGGVRFSVAPSPGLAILFWQGDLGHDLWHDGQPILTGTKYILRTDVMFKRE